MRNFICISGEFPLAKNRNDYKKGVAREATQHIAVEQILETFEEKGVPCMPLKGCLVKYLYPRPDMRLMVDIDIFFKTKQAEKVKKIMQGQGYTVKHQGGNHDVYYRQPYMNIEMHHRLISENSPYSSYLDKTWDRAKLKADCQYTYDLSCEDFFIYLLIHLTKHYTRGGTGIRSFLDIWVYKGRYKDEMDWNYIQAELNKISLREFTENILGLCEVWFGNAQSNTLYEEMTAYIFSSGAYGTWKHSVISSLGVRVGKKKLPGKLAYWLNLFFPPAEILKNSYPLLIALPFLLPACWVLRGVKCLLFKRRHMFHMINNVYLVSEKDIVIMENMHKKAGLVAKVHPFISK
ncbi:MAG: nucleotidyltransferase domain-containing protein [Desulfitobacteriaceae bacterium]